MKKHFLPMMLLISAFLLSACQPAAKLPRIDSASLSEESKEETKETVHVVYPEEDYFYATLFLGGEDLTKEYPAFPEEPEHPEGVRTEVEEQLIGTSITPFSNGKIYSYRDSAFKNGKRTAITYGRTDNNGIELIYYSELRKEIYFYFGQLNTSAAGDTLLSDEEIIKICEDFLLTVMSKEKLASYETTLVRNGGTGASLVYNGTKTWKGTKVDDYFNVVISGTGVISVFNWECGGWFDQAAQYLTQDLLDSAKQKLIDEYCLTGKSADDFTSLQIRKDYLGNVYLSATFKRDMWSSATLNYLLFTIEYK